MALPFAHGDAMLRPVVLLLGGELRLVVALRLAAETGLEMLNMLAP
jgi:hypothetical protein